MWKSSLEPLREPIKEKFNGIINQLFDDEQSSDITNSSKDQIEKLIDERLAQLQPKDVKEIIQRMIKTIRMACCMGWFFWRNYWINVNITFLNIYLRKSNFHFFSGFDSNI